MSVPQVVYTTLRSLVADRVYPATFPQADNRVGPTWPAIRYTLISGDPAGTLCGTTSEDGDDIRVQIDMVAATWPAMRALKASVLLALEVTDPPCARQPGAFETYDAETKTYRASIDYLFQQSSATP